MSAVILDCGTSLCRVGFSTSLEPQVIVPTIVGWPKTEEGGQSTALPHVIGDQALTMYEELTKIRYPIQHGFVDDWESMELLLHEILVEKLQCQPGNHPFIVCQKDNTPGVHKEKMLEILYESHQAPSLLLISTSTMSLHGTGRTTGMVVDLGEGDCLPAPVHEGNPLRNTMHRTLISGSSLTSYLLRLMEQKGLLDSNLSTHRLCAKSIKEQLCYVSQDYTNELKSFSNEYLFSLPDGREITVGKERVMCPEALFDQNMLGFEMPGLGECVFRALISCPETLQSEIFSNIVLCGGSSFFPGLSTRLLSELQSLAGSSNMTHGIEVTHCSHRHAAFYGASLLASSDNYLPMCLSKDFYDEYGPEVCRKHFG